MTQAFKTLQDWLDWQETLHPTEIDLGLERVAKVLQQLLPSFFSSTQKTNPFTVISVAGTNGKGSTVAMLEAIFTQAGYEVGSYTSPHLIHYNERIKRNQKPVSDQELCDAFTRIDAARGEHSLTYFEFGTLAAIDIFCQQQCDIVILEVGLGGRLDAVNIIDADVALITTVDIDHQEWLGHDRNAIALEKAGIYRQDKPAIYGDIDIPESLQEKINHENLEFYQFSQDYSVQERRSSSPLQWDWLVAPQHSEFLSRYNLPPPDLKGAVQLKNAANVLMVIELLKGICPVSQAEIKRGLQNTYLPGRFQVVSDKPYIVLDVAHNVQAAKNLKQSLMQMSVPGKKHAIVGMLKDKEISEVLSVLNPVIDSWRIIELDSPRSMPATQFKTILKNEVCLSTSKKKSIQCFSNFAQAYDDFLKQNASSGDTLVVFGSFFTITDALKSFHSFDKLNPYE